MSQNFHSFSVRNDHGQTVPLAAYRGKTVLVVNVASKCGFTPQYKGLEELYEKYKEKDFAVVGFPCNQFGSQEPGTDSEIQNFCSVNYGVTFPVMAKIDVNGDKADPLYQWMKAAAPGVLGTEAIKWNFTKFLIGPNGEVVSRYAPQTEPKDLTKDIENLLNNK